MASIRNRLRSRAAATMAVACTRSRANGFSQSTGLPASRNISVSEAWRTWGEATYDVDLGILGQGLVGAVGPGDAVLAGGYLRLSIVRDATAATSPSGTSAMSLANRAAIPGGRGAPADGRAQVAPSATDAPRWPGPVHPVKGTAVAGCGGWLRRPEEVHRWRRRPHPDP